MLFWSWLDCEGLCKGLCSIKVTNLSVMSPSSMVVTTAAVSPIKADVASSKTFILLALRPIYLDRAMGETQTWQLVLLNYWVPRDCTCGRWEPAPMKGAVRSYGGVHWHPQGNSTSEEGEGFRMESREVGVGEQRNSLPCLSHSGSTPQNLLDLLSAPGVFTPWWPPSFPALLASPPSFCFLGLDPKQTLCPRF